MGLFVVFQQRQMRSFAILVTSEEPQMQYFAHKSEEFVCRLVVIGRLSFAQNQSRTDMSGALVVPVVV